MIEVRTIEEMAQNVARRTLQELKDNGVFVSRWIPLKTRPLTDEERTYYGDLAEYDAEMFDCPLPDDGQEVLISCGGYVCTDIFARDENDGCYFEGVDIDDVEAWMPLPEPYLSENPTGSNSEEESEETE